jgi:hypothetical protein
LEHGKGSELLDNQQRASRDDANRNILFLMLNAGHPVCRSPIPLYRLITVIIAVDVIVVYALFVLSVHVYYVNCNAKT